MLESILYYEKDLFLLLNSFHSKFWDQFMWLFSGKIAWIPVAVLFVVILSYKNRLRWKELILVFVAIAFVITLCDQFASGLCKHQFERFRPTHHPDFMDKVNIVFDYRGGYYGFISSHAANAFGFATLTSLIFRYTFYSVTIYTWAIVNSYSRIFLGVHFISDIVPGIIAGIIFGWVVYKLTVIVHRKIIAGNALNSGEAIDPYKGIGIISYMLIFTVVVMMVISMLYHFNIITALTMK